MITKYEFRINYPKDLRKIGTDPAIIRKEPSVWALFWEQAFGATINFGSSVYLDLLTCLQTRTIPEHMQDHLIFAAILGSVSYVGIALLERQALILSLITTLITR